MSKRGMFLIAIVAVCSLSVILVPQIMFRLLIFIDYDEFMTYLRIVHCCW